MSDKESMAHRASVKLLLDMVLWRSGNNLHIPLPLHKQTIGPGNVQETQDIINQRLEQQGAMCCITRLRVEDGCYKADVVDLN